MSLAASRRGPAPSLAAAMPAAFMAVMGSARNPMMAAAMTMRQARVKARQPPQLMEQILI